LNKKDITSITKLVVMPVTLIGIIGEVFLVPTQIVSTMLAYTDGFVG